MKISDICVGGPKTVETFGKPVVTSIFKDPVKGAAFASFENIAGDRQADLSVHGGRDKAIYAYSRDYYKQWAKWLNRPQLEPSQFGENLTLEHCDDDKILIGSQYYVSSAVVTVTQPRIPCYKLGIRFGDNEIPKTFWEKGLLGFYLRVEKEGHMQRGDIFALKERPSHEITVRGLWEILMRKDKTGAKNALGNLQHLDPGWQKRLLQVASK